MLFLSISIFYFLVFLFLHFLVVGSVQLTHVGFRAHIKIASCIVSHTFYATHLYMNLIHTSSFHHTISQSATIRQSLLCKNSHNRMLLSSYCGQTDTFNSSLNLLVIQTLLQKTSTRHFRSPLHILKFSPENNFP